MLLLLPTRVLTTESSRFLTTVPTLTDTVPSTRFFSCLPGGNGTRSR